MDVLLIAPEHVELESVEEEVRAISRFLRPYALRGAVTRGDVLDAVISQSWDGIWFATHGDADGILLSGDKLTTAELIAQVRNSGATWIVLNTCSSESIGRELLHETGCTVVTTLAPIADTMAYQTGVLMARNLAQGLDIAAAYEQSAPGGNQVYRFFAPRTSEKKR